MFRKYMCAFQGQHPTSRRPTIPWSLALIAAISAMTSLGCGKGNGRSAVYPAEGQVLVNGQPLAGAQVVFYPQSQSGENTVAPRAQTESDGRFKLTTYANADGAPEGEYVVTVLHYPLRQVNGGWAPGSNSLPPKYASPKTTDLRAQIVKGTNSLPALTLRY